MYILYTSIGRIIRIERERLNLSQEKLGFIIGWTQSKISRFESAKSGSGVDSIARIAEISRALNLDPVDVLSRSISLTSNTEGKMINNRKLVVHPDDDMEIAEVWCDTDSGARAISVVCEDFLADEYLGSMIRNAIRNESHLASYALSVLEHVRDELMPDDKIIRDYPAEEDKPIIKLIVVEPGMAVRNDEIKNLVERVAKAYYKCAIIDPTERIKGIPGMRRIRDSSGSYIVMQSLPYTMY